ncbi:hypothetical protein EMIT0111MI5_10141 [Burkholderia sp. IT-111MI5]
MSSSCCRTTRSARSRRPACTCGPSAAKRAAEPEHGNVSACGRHGTNEGENAGCKAFVNFPAAPIV